jgi:hypothetical protein
MTKINSSRARKGTRRQWRWLISKRRQRGRRKMSRCRQCIRSRRRSLRKQPGLEELIRRMVRMASNLRK